MDRTFKTLNDAQNDTLCNFIRAHVDEILEEWVAFARKLTAGKNLDLEALRDHARNMLLAVADEMTAEQTDAQQQQKSRGESPADANAEESAAQTHGDQRFEQGFKLENLVAEYRALRATVVRLWTHNANVTQRTLYELTRFNEGIDQLLAESVTRYSRQLDRARELFMGVLGHDLRTDLHVILTCATRLQTQPTKEQVDKYVPYLNESARRILTMSEDLLDVARTRLGSQLPIQGSLMNATAACEEVVHSFSALHPARDIRLEIHGDVQGMWDRPRIQQMLINLVRNAFQHGDDSHPVTLRARREDDSVLFQVHNFGKPISPALLSRLFEPLQQGDERNDASSLGLGLYIASTIAHAHQGTLTVRSTATEGTTFSARLPTNLPG